MQQPKRKPSGAALLKASIALSSVCSIFVSGESLAGNLDARTILEDTKLYFTAPLRWDAHNWTYFGGALLAIGAAHQYDDDVRNHFVDGSHAAPAGEDPNSTEQALPTVALLAGTWVAAVLTQDKTGYEETWSMAEAGALSAVSGFALKYAFGRERPNETADANAWFADGDSFPSLHTTAAFAVGTVLAESGNDRYRWVRRALGYGVAGGTAYLRMRDNVHWLSDTVAGAALGMASAHFVMNRRENGRRRAEIMLMPLNDGVMLTYSATIR